MPFSLSLSLSHSHFFLTNLKWDAEKGLAPTCDIPLINDELSGLLSGRQPPPLLGRCVVSLCSHCMVLAEFYVFMR